MKMEMAFVRMDQKFRLVVPKRLRDSINLRGNGEFLMYTFENLIFLRSLDISEGGAIKSVMKIKGLEGAENG